MARRRGYVTIDTSVDVEVSDVLAEATDADLLDELASRKKSGPPNDLEEIRHLLMRGKAQEALVLVERLMFAVSEPRVPSLVAYEKAKAARDPVTGHPLIN